MGYKDYEWYVEHDFSNYAGKWVAIIDRSIVSNNTNLKKLLKDVKQSYPHRTPFVTKINNNLSIL